jgi:hypothetical protein
MQPYFPHCTDTVQTLDMVHVKREHKPIDYSLFFIVSSVMLCSILTLYRVYRGLYGVGTKKQGTLYRLSREETVLSGIQIH